MKISELSTDKGLDVLVELTPYVSSIATSETLTAELKKLAETKRESLKSQLQQLVFGADMFSRLIPILLKERRNDVYGIISVLNEKPVEEVAAQNIMKTVAEIREIFSDGDLLSFFKSFVERKPTK
jgi:hypothetical protein